MGNACSNILSSNPADIILLVFALIVLVVLIGCVWAFFYAVFLFIFSKGDDGKIKSAWNSIRYMVLGLFMTVMLLFLGPALLKLFRMQNSDEYSVKYIFVKIGNIMSCVGTGIVSVVKDYPNNNPFDSSDDLLGTTQTMNSIDNGLTVYDL